MSLIPLGFWAASGGGGGNATYRLQTLGGDKSDWAYGVSVDSDFNSFLGGRLTSTPAGNYDFFVSKSDPEGIVLWQRYLAQSANDELQTVVTDSSGNVYLAGTSNDGGTVDACIIAKYSTDGVIQWQKSLKGASGSVVYMMYIDSSDNLFIAGRTLSGGVGGNDGFLAKYNTAGVLQWQTIIGSTDTEIMYGIGTDSSGNVYLGGKTNGAGGSITQLLLVKYNSAGTIQWQRVLGGTENASIVDLALDSLGNIYLAGGLRDSGGDPNRGWLVKYNSSGTVIWERYFSDASVSLNTISMAIDSSDNIYQLTSSDLADAGDKHLVWSKWDTSGNLVLQRRLGSTLEERAYRVRLDSADNLYLVGGTTGAGVLGWDMFLAVLPNDGSLTGTYSLDGADYTYEATSFTSSTPSHTAATSTLTTATGTLTAGDATLVSSTASLTGYQIDL